MRLTQVAGALLACALLGAGSALALAEHVADTAKFVQDSTDAAIAGDLAAVDEGVDAYVTAQAAWGVATADGAIEAALAEWATASQATSGATLWAAARVTSVSSAAVGTATRIVEDPDGTVDAGRDVANGAVLDAHGKAQQVVAMSLVAAGNAANQVNIIAATGMGVAKGALDAASVQAEPALVVVRDARGCFHDENVPVAGSTWSGVVGACQGVQADLETLLGGPILPL